MTFLNPLFLVGLLAASIPLLLHLLNLRRLRTVEFSSIRFLKEIQKSRMRRLRLRQILLLILRTMLIAFAVLAFARPALQGDSVLPGAHAATSAVILVDNSPSMELVAERGNRLAAAKRAANEIVDALEGGDDAWLVTMTDPGQMMGVPSTQSHDELHLRIDSIRTNYRPADLDASLRTAAALLNTSDNLNKEIYVVTDGQACNVAPALDSTKLFSRNTRVFVMQAPSVTAAPPDNLGIDSVRILSSVFQVGKPVDVRIWVHNYGSYTATDRSVALYLNDSRGTQGTVNVGARGTIAIDLSVSPRSAGPQAGYVELGHDALEADNRRYFAFPLPERLRVAVIGAPAALRYLSVAYALMPSVIDVRFLPAGSLSSVDLDNTAAVVVGDAMIADAVRLSAYVRNGGGLVLFTGPGTDRLKFNSGLGAQLGIELGAVKSIGGTQTVRFGSVDRDHAIFAGVFDPAKAGTEFDSPDIRTILPPMGGQGIIRLTDGIPFLSEFRCGRGRVVVVSVPPTDDWSDFPSRTIFPPIALRAAVYVGTRTDEYPSIVAGENVMYQLSRGDKHAKSVRLTSPDAHDRLIPVREDPSGPSVAIDQTEQRGVYRISSGSSVVGLVTVNSDRKESDLSCLTVDELTNRIRAHAAAPEKIRSIERLASLRSAVLEGRFGLELWKYALIAAIACALAEMVVVRRLVDRA